MWLLTPAPPPPAPPPPGPSSPPAGVAADEEELNASEEEENASEEEENEDDEEVTDALVRDDERGASRPSSAFAEPRGGGIRLALCSRNREGVGWQSIGDRLISLYDVDLGLPLPRVLDRARARVPRRATPCQRIAAAPRASARARA